MSALELQYITCDAPGCSAVHEEGHVRRREARRSAAQAGWRFRVWAKKAGIAPVADFCPAHGHLADADAPPHDHRRRMSERHALHLGVGRGKTWHDAVKARASARTLDAEGCVTTSLVPVPVGSDG